MADRLTRSRGPTEAEFSAACQIVTRYVSDPESGWDRGRSKRLGAQLTAWETLLSDNMRHASYDAEKS